MQVVGVQGGQCVEWSVCRVVGMQNGRCARSDFMAIRDSLHVRMLTNNQRQTSSKTRQTVHKPDMDGYLT